LKLSVLLEKSGMTNAIRHRQSGIDPDITAVVQDSRRVMPGALFVAIKGAVSDGHDYVAEAIARGAAAVVVQRALDATIPVIQVPDTRSAFGCLVSAIYGNPSEFMNIIALVGTNGKTTTAFLLEHILHSAGYEAGLIGTVACRFRGREFPAGLTTPDADDLQRTLSRMQNSKVTHVVMEVSSHAICHKRISGCVFSGGVFTNLSQDHLDFHGDMKTYWAVKKSFFTHYLSGVPDSWAVVNIDDAHGRELAEKLADIRVITVGTSLDAHVHPKNVRFSDKGISGEIVCPKGRISFDSSLVGRFNLENILCAFGAALALGINPKTISAGIQSLGQVPGRLEPVSSKAGPRVYVDFAHTPEALENLLDAVSGIAAGRIICVFGCGGDRDRTKRPIMGRIAGQKADLSIITSDNPRTERPDGIIEEIVSGLSGLCLKHYEPDALVNGFLQKGYAVVQDRKHAIFLAVRAAEADDVVVIAGKGHETYQIIGREKHPFDDRMVAQMALSGEDAA